MLTLTLPPVAFSISSPNLRPPSAHVLPALVNEFIVLIKETSIIGYIGMMDLTKGAMLIQSRTYNAFWPLMAAAAIYLVIVGILTWGMNKLERRLRTSER